MRSTDGTQLIRDDFSAFQARDRAAMEKLLSDDFTFTSPFDDRLDKAAYFARCWPQAQRFRQFEIETLCDRGDEAFVRYECAIETGPRFRNLEYFRIEGERICEVEVYFGSLPDESPVPG